MKSTCNSLVLVAITVSVMLNLFAYCPQYFQTGQTETVGLMPVSLPVKASKGNVEFSKVLKEVRGG